MDDEVAWTTNAKDIVNYLHDLPANELRVTFSGSVLRIVNVQNRWVFTASPRLSDGKWRVQAWNTSGEKPNPKPSWDRSHLWSNPTAEDGDAAVLAAEVFLAEYPDPAVDILVDDADLRRKGMISGWGAENVLMAILDVRREALRRSDA